MPNRRVTETERQQIIDLLEDGLSHNAIAKQVGRSHQTVGRIAREVGHDVDQSNLARVEKAQETRRAVNAERRAHLAAFAADRAEELLTAFHDPVEELVPVPGVGAEKVTRKVQPKDHHYRSSSFGALMRHVMEVAKYDERGQDGSADVDEWLDWLTARPKG